MELTQILFLNNWHISQIYFVWNELAFYALPIIIYKWTFGNSD